MKYFQLFDLSPIYNLDKKNLKKKYFTLSKQMHPDKFVQLEDRVLKAKERDYALLNKAYETLMNDEKRFTYLLQELDIIQTDENYSLAPEFLMEMMELNEQFMDDPDQAAQELSRLEKELQDEVVEIMEAESWEDLDASKKGKLKDYYYKMKYLQRAGQKA